ncbi:hypothetical protein QUF72_23465 [Desulfobacterales bacterium HSG2]|nr:hypothetical protein [Desulfobacterales bacterium HSG2]
MFDQAVDNVRPMIEVKSRRVGGSTYQVRGRGPDLLRPGGRLPGQWVSPFPEKRSETGRPRKQRCPSPPGRVFR